MSRKPLRRKGNEKSPRVRRRPAKKRSWSRESGAERSHWLGEEESLPSELDPLLYAIDASIHRCVKSTAHSYDGNEKRPFAVYMPLSETIGWHAAYLVREFNTYLLTEDELDGLGAASDFFGLELLDIEAFDELDHWIDLFLSTNYVWSSRLDFCTFMNENLPLLSPDGRAYAVLRGCAPLTVEDDNDIVIPWYDGSSSTIAEIRNFRWFEQAELELARTVCLSAVNPSDPALLNTFCKRNKRFFGKELSQMMHTVLSANKEFSGVFELPDADQLSDWAVLLCWKSVTTY